MKKLALGILFCLLILLIPTPNAQGQEIGEGGNLDELDIGLEFESNGRLNFDVTAQGEMSMESGGFGEDIPFTSAEGGLEVSSPDPGQLELDAEASLTFSENYITPQMEVGFEMIGKKQINEGIDGYFGGLNSFEGKQLSTILSEYGEGTFEEGLPGESFEGGIPPELADLTIGNLSCTSFSWDKPQVSASFKAALSGTIFENERLLEWLPLNFDFSLEISETSMDMTAEADSPKGEVDMTLTSDLSGDTQPIEISVEGYTELPRDGENVHWDFKSSEIQTALSQGDFPQDLQSQLGETNVSVTLKFPSGAEVSGLPSDAQEKDGEYTWTGEDATSALSSISTGQTETEVTYEYESSGGGLPYTWIGLGIAILVILSAFGLLVRR